MSVTESRVVLITGASSGIGAGIAKAFAKEGSYLSLIAIDNENFDQVVQDCKDNGAKDVLKIISDLTKKSNMEMVMNETINKFNRLDVLINNAGKTCFGGVEMINLEEFDSTFSINTRTPLYLTQLAVPHLQKTKGSIVNMSSIASKLYTIPIVLGYCLSKVALDQLTKISALELASKGIRVNSINLSTCDTPILQATAEKMGVDLETMKAAGAENHILNKKLLEVSDVVQAVVFLTSDKAKMITGVNLVIDGGRQLTGQ